MVKIMALPSAPVPHPVGADGTSAPRSLRHHRVRGFVVTASLADANLWIWQPLSNFFSLVPLESAPQWLTFTGYILTVGLTTGPVSFFVRRSRGLANSHNIRVSACWPRAVAQPWIV
jgi:hypothetical protein